MSMDENKGLAKLEARVAALEAALRQRDECIGELEGRLLQLQQAVPLATPPQDSAPGSADGPRILWVSGIPNAGKTWLGDYLDSHHGWLHVEGDEDMMIHGDGEGALYQGVLTAITQHWIRGCDAPEELWAPYYRALCRKALALRAGNPSAPGVAVTFPAHRRANRDFVRAEMGNVHVEFLLLHVAPEQFKPGSGYPMFMLRGLKNGAFQPFGDDEAGCNEISTADDHVHVVPGVRKLLGLGGEATVDVAKIAQCHKLRDKEYKERREALAAAGASTLSTCTPLYACYNL